MRNFSSGETLAATGDPANGATCSCNVAASTTLTPSPQRETSRCFPSAATRILCHSVSSGLLFSSRQVSRSRQTKPLDSRPANTRRLGQSQVTQTGEPLVGGKVRSSPVLGRQSQSPLFATETTAWLERTASPSGP